MSESDGGYDPDYCLVCWYAWGSPFRVRATYGLADSTRRIGFCDGHRLDGAVPADSAHGPRRQGAG